MHEKTLEIMVKVERRLKRLSYMEATSCGFDENVRAANRQYNRLMKFLEKELDELCEKGGVK